MKVQLPFPPSFMGSVLCRKPLQTLPTGCGGNCFSTSSCEFLHKLHDAACKQGHCQCCLMPLKRQCGVNMHPSGPGWKNCTFQYKEHVRKYLVLAALGEKLHDKLPQGFPSTGPNDALVHWALATPFPLSPPNIVHFVAAMLGVDSKF